ncbi:hypothetical protein PSACC_00067 [Paramicrosporidium saccamoebae]|uniref:Uncharacterized protein n=1 Tax=Paramicrosporidium saccamoebae TaxID=1246581 RepID=A0A2H9TQT9_9FUNG|nr:hypothetical protein PSACC_00067 [Paramicrosporidium saccamoebae]
MSVAASADLGSGAPSPLQPIMPTKHWTPRQQLQNLNDFLSLGPLDRWDFWASFASSFWAPGAVALRIRLGLEENDGVFEIPSTLVSQFFWTWSSSGAMRRLFFDTTQATEGSSVTGPTLASSHAVIESILLEGALLVRQQARIRCIFDLYGRITLLDLQVHAHDEYVLSAVAGSVLASNGLSMCRYGFPMSVYRQLELLLVVREMLGEVTKVTTVPWQAMGSKRARKKKHHSNE